MLPFGGAGSETFLTLSVLKMSPNGTQNGTHGHSNKVSVVLGAQWGDEGKGKLVDLLTENMEVVCR